MKHRESKTVYKACRLHNGIQQFLKRFGIDVVDRKIGKDRIMDIQSGNDRLKKLILEGKPLLAIKFGTTETGITKRYLEKKMGMIEKIPDISKETLCTCSGFFPYDSPEEDFERFCKLELDCSKDIDFLAMYRHQVERYIKLKYIPSGPTSWIRALEPYDHKNPWTKALEGKKVLVVSPFASTIESQYAKRELLFEDKDILPEFELITYRAVQTLAGEPCAYGNWFEALEAQINDIKKLDFDIALLGCGAYGLPIAREIKKMGKQAVYVGGSLQILFGIKGKRWEENELSRLFNEHWVYPSDEDRPKNAELVEGSCYWK